MIIKTKNCWVFCYRAQKIPSSFTIVKPSCQATLLVLTPLFTNTLYTGRVVSKMSSSTRLLWKSVFASRLFPLMLKRSFSTPTFRGTFISKPSSCVNIRVFHPKYKRSKDGIAMVLANPGSISFEVAPGVAGSRLSDDSEPGSNPGYNWEKKVYSL